MFEHGCKKTNRYITDVLNYQYCRSSLGAHIRTLPYIYIYIHTQVNSHVEESVCLSKKELVCRARRPCFLHVPCWSTPLALLRVLPVSQDFTYMSTNKHTRTHIIFVCCVYVYGANYCCFGFRAIIFAQVG